MFLVFQFSDWFLWVVLDRRFLWVVLDLGCCGCSVLMPAPSLSFVFDVFVNGFYCGGVISGDFYDGFLPSVVRVFSHCRLVSGLPCQVLGPPLLV